MYKGKFWSCTATSFVKFTLSLDDHFLSRQASRIQNKHIRNSLQSMQCKFFSVYSLGCENRKQLYLYFLHSFSNILSMDWAIMCVMVLSHQK